MTDLHKFDDPEYFQELVKTASDHDACSGSIELIRKYKTINEALIDPKASYWCYWYAMVVIEGRWIEAEPIIMTNPKYACNYVYEIIEDRWPEAEPIIMTSPKCAYYYARYIIEDRWPEAEPYIMTGDPYYAYLYARDIIKGIWPEAESTVMSNNLWWDAYKKHFNIQTDITKRNPINE